MRYLLSLLLGCLLALVSPTAHAAQVNGGQTYGPITVAANNVDFAVVDTINYGTIMVGVTSVGGGATVSWQGSNTADFAAVVALVGVPSTVLGTTPVTSTTAVGSWIILPTTRYLRVRTTAYTSGNIIAFVYALNRNGSVDAIFIAGGSLGTNQSTNVSQINAVTPLMGNGTTGTGSLRVTLASDGTANSNPFLVVGSAAHSGASTGSPVRQGGRVQTAVDTTLVAGDVSDTFITTNGSQVVKTFGIPELDWTYAAASGGITNTTTAVTFRAAAAAGVRNHVTGISLMADPLGTATEIAIRDGAGGTVLWRSRITTTGLISGTHIAFPTPLRGTAATLLEVVTLTASGTGSVFFNAQGYQAP